MSSQRRMPFAKFSNLIHKFDSMYVTDFAPDMMEGKIFKGWAGRLCLLLRNNPDDPQSRPHQRNVLEKWNWRTFLRVNGI